MRCQIFILSFVFVILFPTQMLAKNKCFEAKTCIHDGKEKCGQDKNGNIRRFLDTCDMKEYNCLKEADYDKVSFETCKKLPPIGESAPEKNSVILQQGADEEDDNEENGADNGEGSVEVEFNEEEENEEDGNNDEDETPDKKQ